MTGAYVLLHPAGQFDAVHLWHHDVTDDDVGYLFHRQHRTLIAVLSLNDAVIFAHRVGDILSDVAVVLHHEQQRAFVICRLVHPFAIHF